MERLGVCELGGEAGRRAAAADLDRATLGGFGRSSAGEEKWGRGEGGRLGFGRLLGLARRWVHFGAFDRRRMDGFDGGLGSDPWEEAF
jgi:hypothetical protein